MTADDWVTNRTRRDRARLMLAARTSWPTPCVICGVLLQPWDDWHLGHVLPRRLYPELTWQARNHRVECSACSRREGGRLGGRLSGTIRRGLSMGGPRRVAQISLFPPPGKNLREREGNAVDSPVVRSIFRKDDGE